MGLAAIAVTAAFLMGKVSLEQFLGALGMLTGGGLVAAKDGDK